jgi:hypothetical protein
MDKEPIDYSHSLPWRLIGKAFVCHLIEFCTFPEQPDRKVIGSQLFGDGFFPDYSQTIHK